jgi:anti-sigma regulatory factor (Ser/Thr protein kinase)
MLAGSTNTLPTARQGPLLDSARKARGFSLHGDSACPLEGLPDPRGTVREIPFGEGDLSELRERVLSWALHERMASEPAEDLVLAVHEITANALRHGGGAGVLRLWRERRVLYCEVQDSGYIEDPLLALRAPDMSSSSGRGLWIANKVCDLLQIHSSASGNRVRLHKQLG